MDKEVITNMEVGRELDALVGELVMGLKLPNRFNANFYSTDIAANWRLFFSH